MLKFITGFVFGAAMMFILCAVALIAKDERDTKRRIRNNETGAFWHNKKKRYK